MAGPLYSAPFVGVVEITCGTLLILGLFTSFATILISEKVNARRKS
ncbi:MAG: hypothetical protein ABI147_10680 [Acidobacteriaceae bacterium]